MARTERSILFLVAAVSEMAVAAEGVRLSNGRAPLAEPLGAGTRYTVAPALGQPVPRTGAPRHVFYKFQQLDLDAGSEVRFTGPVSIKNIIARIDSGQPSSINGRLAVRLGSNPDTIDPLNSANLFLINPSGVLFGPRASFDVRGAVVVTTANRVKVFDADPIEPADQPDAMLTISPIASFGFDENPQGVSFQNREGGALAIHDGQTLSVVAGDISISQTNLVAARGRVNLVSVGSAGTINDFDATDVNADPPDLSSFNNRGNVFIDGGSTGQTAAGVNASGIDGDGERVDTDGNILPTGDGENGQGFGRGGRIVIRGGRLTVAGAESRLTTRNKIPPASMDEPAGIDQTPDIEFARGVDINLTRKLTLRGGKIETATATADDAGPISIIADDADVLDGAKIDSSVRDVNERRGGDSDNGLLLGNGGAIVLDLSGDLRLEQTQPVRGDEGGDRFLAGIVLADDFYKTRIVSGVDDQGIHTTSAGGAITITARNVQVGLLGSISSRARATGSSGDITITADHSLKVANPTGSVAGRPLRTAAEANAANVNDFDTLQTTGSSPTINASIETGNSNGFLFAPEDDNNTVGAGNAGAITLTADRIDLRFGGRVLSESKAVGVQGDDLGIPNGVPFDRPYAVGGNITLNARGGPIDMVGAKTGVSASATKAFSGPPGTVSILGGDVQLLEGASVSAVARGSYGGGEINVGSEALPLQSLSIRNRAQISTRGGVQPGTSAGDIRVFAKQIVLSETDSSARATSDQAAIKSNSVSSSDDAGNVAGNGGNITIETEKLVVGANASITVDAPTVAQNSTDANAGRINITGGDVVVSGKNAFIEALSKGRGDGGAIDIVVDNIRVLDGGAITAQSTAGRGENPLKNPGDAGNINLTATNDLEVRGTEGGRAEITTSAFGASGGNITLNVINRVDVERGRIFTEGAINGGNILIDPRQVVVGKFGNISTDAGTLQAGNIQINISAGGGFLQSTLASITAISGAGENFNGVIEITSPDKDFAAELLTLNGELVSPEARLHECCELKLSRDLSSFTAKPLPALPLDPAGWQPVLRLGE